MILSLKEIKKTELKYKIGDCFYLPKSAIYSKEWTDSKEETDDLTKVFEKGNVVLKIIGVEKDFNKNLFYCMQFVSPDESHGWQIDEEFLDKHFNKIKDISMLRFMIMDDD